MREPRSRFHKKKRFKLFTSVGSNIPKHAAFPLVLTGLLVLTALLIPVVLVVRQETPILPIENVTSEPIMPPVAENVPEAEPEVEPEVEPVVSVYLTVSGEIESLPLEQYLVGVVAAEMPANFELEALKAQTIAARTYIVRRIMTGDRSGVPEAEADVTDTINHQAYLSSELLESTWSGPEAASKLNKIKRAVAETRGIVMTYNGQPITASFFSTSNGYTENSEEVWSNKIAYLRSVPSPWDERIAPKYKQIVSYTREEFLSLLGIMGNHSSKSNNLAKPRIQIQSLSKGHRIKEITIEGNSFSGREVRERLGLRSSEFSWKWTGDEIEITTYGYGHGVGMSQWGANGMAQEGYSVKEILQHYYTGITFDEVERLLSKNNR